MYWGEMVSRNSVPAGHAQGGELEEEFARDAQAAVDVEGVVEVGIVDEALPAHGGAGLLEVDPHDDQEVVGIALHEVLEAVPYSTAAEGSWIEQGPTTTRRRSSSPGRIASASRRELRHQLGRLVGDGQIVGEDRRGDEGIDPGDAEVVCLGRATAEGWERWLARCKGLCKGRFAGGPAFETSPPSRSRAAHRGCQSNKMLGYCGHEPACAADQGAAGARFHGRDGAGVSCAYVGSTGEKELDDRIMELARETHSVSDPCLLAEMMITAVRISRGAVTEGDFKLMNRALKEMREANEVFHPYRTAGR